MESFGKKLLLFKIKCVNIGSCVHFEITFGDKNAI